MPQQHGYCDMCKILWYFPTNLNWKWKLHEMDPWRIQWCHLIRHDETDQKINYLEYQNQLELLIMNMRCFNGFQVFWHLQNTWKSSLKHLKIIVCSKWLRTYQTHASLLTRPDQCTGNNFLGCFTLQIWYMNKRKSDRTEHVPQNANLVCAWWEAFQNKICQ